jgi:hypothetical protein
LTVAWQIASTGFRFPVLVRDKAGLGMKIPASITVDEVARIVGVGHKVDVINVMTQTELLHSWALGDLADYFRDKSARYVGGSVHHRRVCV